MRKILLLLTGGTIGCIPTENGLAPHMHTELLFNLLLPLPADINITTKQIFQLDSTDMTAREWLVLADTIEKEYENYDGFVISHGTDTLAFTASALSYLIQNSPKPIVLTGAQQPMDAPESDGPGNLTDAILYSAYENVQDVSVVFNGKVIAGTRAKKIRTHDYDAFDSINYPLLALVHDHKTIESFHTFEYQSNPAFYHNLSEKIGVLMLTPGMTGENLEAYINSYDCLIVQGFGVGGIPKSLFDNLCSLISKQNKLLVLGTQVLYEGTAVETYEVGQRLNGNVHYVEMKDMTFESTFTKMMWVYGQEPNSMQSITSLFTQPINFDRTKKP